MYLESVCVCAVEECESVFVNGEIANLCCSKQSGPVFFFF